MNPHLRRLVLLFLALLTSATNALADGKMFAEKVPTTIPYQRAIILHAEGTQTLVLQSQYQIPGAAETKSIGWVVPVPATPEVASADANKAEWAFNWCDRSAAPKVTHFRSILLLIQFAVAVCITVICIIGAFTARSTERRRRFRIFGRISILVALLLFLTFPFVIPMRKGVSGIETLASKKTGIYDITVIRAKTSADMLQWLNEHSFSFGPEDENVLQSYIERGWVFVAAKIDPAADTTDGKAVSKGLAAPLLLRFPSKNPIYPLALTATGGHNTEILIYLLSDIPRDGDGRLDRRFAGNLRQRQFPYEILMTEQNIDFLDADLTIRKGHIPRLSKFKGTLNPEQMRSDLEFVPDPHQTDCREHVFR